MARIVVGVDLSGPANAAHTVVVRFEQQGEHLDYVDSTVGASDADIVRVLSTMDSGEVIVGLDAPLSYNDGGGDRQADKSLRERIVKAGLRSGSVMTPTFSKMAYLTLRGLGVARALELVGVPRGNIVEVHPGAAFALRGAPVDAVRGFKTNPDHRVALLKWLRSKGVRKAPASMAEASHSIAACGAALATWHWGKQSAAWIWKADPPLHPYDFAC